MIEGKTAALLECTAWLGARFGGAVTEPAERFARFGRQLGLAFQYQDDLIGVWGDEALTGKPVDADIRTRKQALPAVLALQAKGAEAERFRQLYHSTEAMTDQQAREAVALLEALEINTRVQVIVEKGYRQAERDLDLALNGQPSPALHTLLARIRNRQG